MNFKTDKINVPLWVIWVLVVLVVTVLVGYWYYTVDPRHAKLMGLASGILTGLVVYLATFVTLLRPILELDRFHRMGIKGLLANRHDKHYYREIVAHSRSRVDVMGASCSRFVNDFLDVESDDKVLVDALHVSENLKVRLLIPTDKYMSEDVKGRTTTTLSQISAAKERFGDRVELRRFDDEARHSFVVADNDLVAGPIFADDKSRHAPAVHVATETPFGQKYCVYFDTLWNEASA